MSNKIILIGSVGSSELVLNEMIEQNLPPEYVLSLDEKYSSKVSSFVSLSKKAANYNIPNRTFKNINDKENIEIIKSIKPDYIFVVGLSQLVKAEILSIPTKGIVGYHPTELPKFRGRAAIPWQILLGVKKSKCSLFYIDKGMDSGDIIGQESYLIKPDDYAHDVVQSSREAFQKLLHRVLPEFRKGKIKGIPQNEKDATYLLKRTPADGEINWSESTKDIHKLIRASSTPYPGSFSYYNGKNKVIFWKAEIKKNENIIGIPGQISNITNDYIDIICIDGILRVQEFESIDGVSFTVGNKFI